MTVCFLPRIALSASATVYGQLWADRWPAWYPSFGDGEVPTGAAQLRVDAYSVFRSILSAEEELQASADLHLEVITRLAGTSPVVVIRYEFESGQDRERHFERHDMAGLHRDYFLGIADPYEDPPAIVVHHAYRSVLTTDDPLLRALMAEAASGNGFTAVTAPDLTWIAQPHEESMTLTSYNHAHLEVLYEAQRDIQARWRTDQPNPPLINLAAVREHFDAHRQACARQGVQVVTGPQYRTYEGGVFDSVDELPNDPRSADCF